MVTKRTLKLRDVLCKLTSMRQNVDNRALTELKGECMKKKERVMG
jgi:hypothetical protein